MSRPDGQIKINAPHELKEWLKTLAAENRRSLNGEILYRLENVRNQMGAYKDVRR